ncbi:hypothetical protein [Niveibacterium sp. COAC-50]|uniref:hypothetical protein n=1 Tax=Niveibacterium sp. COAC-50 TaxID=2729384 RepID=UPI001C131491|nr:hypothetical protein [Niveibacterium sp. COAC-50]
MNALGNKPRVGRLDQQRFCGVLLIKKKKRHLQSARMTSAPTTAPTRRAEAFGFGDPIPVLDRRALLIA